MRCAARAVLTGLLALVAAPLASQQPDSALEPAPGAQALFRQRLGELVKRQLGLTDAPFQRLVEVNQKYDGQRRLLVQQERDLRIALRDEILRDEQADQKHTAWLLDEVVKVQHARLSILENELKDLSAFLTPIQRAKYFAIQEQVRKRLEAARNQQLNNGLTPQQRQRLQEWRLRPGRPLPAPAPAPPPPAPPPN